MEGVGARLGRSSSRYGTTTVFTGPVRKWKKKWVNVPPSNSSHQHHHTAANGASNASSRLSLYKWTPITPSQNKDGNNDDAVTDGNADSKNSDKNDAVAAEELPKKKFKYIPIIMLEEQNNESSEQNDDEDKPSETDKNDVEATSKSDGFDEKPNINDLPMEGPEKNDLESGNMNESSTFDLNLGGENKSDSKADDQVEEDDQSE